jgi:hypothetical protein
VCTLSVRGGRGYYFAKTQLAIASATVTQLHPNCELINGLLAQAGLPGRVRILPEPAPTAAIAAAQVGVEVGAIANSLIFARPKAIPCWY